MNRRLRARHADRNCSGGDDKRNGKRDGGEKFDAATPAGEALMGDGGRETDLPAQLCHGGCLIGSSRVAIRIGICVIAKSRVDLGEAIEEERRLCDFWLTNG
ncbi:MAG TPA: hypothetical protein VEK31_00130 [Xanthobacteraceae bacterium]|nr:hypothetical protein [Xanthobacteraceae bacterium]